MLHSMPHTIHYYIQYHFMQHIGNFACGDLLHILIFQETLNSGHHSTNHQVLKQMIKLNRWKERCS